MPYFNEPVHWTCKASRLSPSNSHLGAISQVHKGNFFAPCSPIVSVSPSSVGPSVVRVQQTESLCERALTMNEHHQTTWYNNAAYIRRRAHTLFHLCVYGATRLTTRRFFRRPTWFSQHPGAHNAPCKILNRPMYSGPIKSESANWWCQSSAPICICCSKSAPQGGISGALRNGPSESCCGDSCGTSSAASAWV